MRSAGNVVGYTPTSNAIVRRTQSSPSESSPGDREKRPRALSFSSGFSSPISQLILGKSQEVLKLVHAYSPNPFLSASDQEWMEKIQRTFEMRVSPQTSEALRKQLTLTRNVSGINASYVCYILSDEGKMHVGGIMKFADEEPGAENSLRKEIIQTKLGIPPKQAWIREVIASALHPERIPLTLKMTFEIGKGLRTASMQRFLSDMVSLRSLNAETLSKLPDEEICEMAFVDLHLVNTDRHRGNVLVPKNSLDALYLIDHGCVLSEGFAAKGIFCWYSWERAAFGFSQEYKEKIAAIDIDKDRGVCRDVFPEISDAVLKTLGFATFLLQEGAKQDLTLQEIASFYLSTEKTFELPSCASILYSRIDKEGGGIGQFDSLAKEYIPKIVSWVLQYREQDLSHGSLEEYLCGKASELK